MKRNHFVLKLILILGAQSQAWAQSVDWVEDAVLSASPEAQKILCVVEGSDVVAVTASPDECEERRAQGVTPEQAEKSRKGRFKERLDDLDIKAKLKLIDVDLAEGVSFGARYKYQVDKSFRENYFVRLDRWVMGASLNPGVMLGLGSPLGVGLGDEAEILFAQQFETGSDARHPLNGYSPYNLPVNSSKALDLKPGDYVRFTAQMNLLADIGQAWPVGAAFLQASANLRFILSGSFQVHMFRLDGHRVRMKLVAQRSREKGAHAQLGVKGLEIFGIEKLDNKIVKTLGLDDYLKFSATATNSDLFLLDYVLDLSQPAVAQAYDGLFSKVKRLRNYKIGNPFNSKDELSERLISDFTSLENLAKEHRLLRDPFARGVHRIFKGSNSAYTRAAHFKFGVAVVERERSNVFRQSFLTRILLNENLQESYEYFVVPTWYRSKEKEYLFGIFEEELRQSSNALFVADSAGTPQRFVNMSFTYENEDAKFLQKEFDLLQSKMRGLLTASEYARFEKEMSETAWRGGALREKVSIYLAYFFHGQALLDLVRAGWSDLAKLESALIDYIVEIEGAKSILQRTKQLGGRIKKVYGPDDAHQALWDMNGDDIRKLSMQLQKILAPFAKDGAENAAANRVRLKELTELRHSRLFIRHGTGFLARLLQKSGSEMKNVMYLVLRLNARHHGEFNFTSGEKKDRDLYEVVQFIESLLNGDDMDMRLMGPKDSATSRPVDPNQFLERLEISTN